VIKDTSATDCARVIKKSTFLDAGFVAFALDAGFALEAGFADFAFEAGFAADAGFDFALTDLALAALVAAALAASYKDRLFREQVK
jgi:hypothetical protein